MGTYCTSHFVPEIDTPLLSIGSITTCVLIKLYFLQSNDFEQVMPHDGVTHRNGHTIADDDTDKDEANESAEEPRVHDKGLWRDLVAFWLLGMTNNYGYVVMLSAAHDIIEHFSKSQVNACNSISVDHQDIYDQIDLQSLQETGYIEGPFYEGRNCSIMSTGVLLLANTLPSMAVKMVVPFLPLYILYVSIEYQISFFLSF